MMMVIEDKEAVDKQENKDRETKKHVKDNGK